MKDRKFQRDVDKTIQRIRVLADKTIASANPILRAASRPLVNEIKRRAPVSKEEHSRYQNGQIVATYRPGNLRRSFRVLRFSRSPSLFVGPKVGSDAAADGYYAHWQEFGAPAAGIPPRPFVAPAEQAAGPTVLRLASEALKKQIQLTAKNLYQG